MATSDKNSPIHWAQQVHNKSVNNKRGSVDQQRAIAYYISPEEPSKEYADLLLTREREKRFSIIPPLP